MARYSRESFVKDLAGAAAAASLTLPVGIALGAVTLDSLGPEFASTGVAAGVYGVILCSLLPVLFGSRSTAINVPRSVPAVFVAAMLFEASGTHRAVAGAAPTPEFVHAAAFFFLALAGAFQALIGLFRLGSLVKYLPHPVLAGFMNAVAVLLVLTQVPQLLGMPPGTGIIELLVVPERMQWGATLVAALTLAALALARTLRSRVPGYVVAIVAGTLAHHALAATGWQVPLGSLLGEVPRTLPATGMSGFPGFFDSVAFANLLPGIATAAFGLALIVSLDSLLYMKAFERTTLERADSQRELARLGLANTAAALLGALPCSMSLVASRVNHAAGARTAVSVILHGLIALAVVLSLGPLLGEIPRAVVAIVLVAVSINVFDRQTLATARRLAGGNVSNRARLAMDVLVMLIVASIAMLASVPIAVAAGLLIAVLSFLVNMSHSVVRRVGTGQAMRSRRSRGAQQMELLDRLGSRIAVIELEGVIFFGTADDLLARIEQCLQEGATHVVIDLGRVHDVDTTGAQMLIQIHERVRARNRRLIVSQASPGQPQWNFLVDTGVVKSLGESAFTPDTDRALEIAENALIEEEGGERSVRAEIPLRSLQPFSLLDAAELAVLEPKLARRRFEAGEYVFREGEPGEELYVIALGTASVRRAEGARSVRLVTFGEGTVFGEMALLDASPRSASVQADGPLVCYVMPRAVFEELVERHHAIALKLLTSLSQELGRRLRFANQTINRLQA
ncbi:MAG: SLC26A/SulP transporter family protein [Burkholderiales bacterium]